MNFLKWTSETSTLRVSIFIFTLACGFYICFETATGNGDRIKWAEMSVFATVFLTGKVIQKAIEVRQQKL